MHLSKIGAIALGVALVDAFQDTSPFFFFSSSKYVVALCQTRHRPQLTYSRLLISSPQIVSAASLTNALASNLEKCPSDTYVIVSQPRANAADFSGARSAPHLRKRISGDDENVKSSFSVSDVLGVVDTDLIQSSMEAKCQAGLMTVDASSRSCSGTFVLGRSPRPCFLMCPITAGSFSIIDDMRPRVIRVDFPPLPPVGRAAKLAENGTSTSQPWSRTL